MVFFLASFADIISTFSGNFVSHGYVYIYMYNHWYYDCCHHSGYQCIYGLFLLLYCISLLPLSAFVLPFIVIHFLSLLFCIIMMIHVIFFNWLTLWYIKVLFNIINAFVFFVVIGHLPMHLWLICCCFCFFCYCVCLLCNVRLYTYIYIMYLFIYLSIYSFIIIYIYI